MMRTVILGIGNILLSDESVGVRVIEALGETYSLPEDVLVIDAGTSAMELLGEIADADLLIVVDAVFSGQPPGNLVHLSGRQVPVFFRSKLSPHQVGLSDVLASLEFSGESPRETVVIGVEPESFALGLTMTPTVAARVPDLVQMVVAELAAHGVAVAPLALLAET